MSLRSKTWLVVLAGLVSLAAILYLAWYIAGARIPPAPSAALLGAGLLLGGGVAGFSARRLQTLQSQGKIEGLYQTLAEAAQDVIFIADRDLKIEYANTFAANQFGMTPRQVFRKSIDDLFPPEAASIQKKELQRVFATGEPTSYEHNSYFGSRPVWLDTRLVPLTDRSGSVTSILGISRDISERKSAEQAERRRHSSIQALSDFDHAITSTLDLTTRLDLLLEHTLTYMQADIAFVYLCDPATDELFLLAQQGARHPAAWTAFRMAMGQGVTGSIAANGNPIVIDDIHVSGLWIRNETTEKESIVAYLGVPLRVNDRIIGVLDIATRSPRAFRKEEIDYLEALGDRAAVAIQNARLFEETQLRAREFSALYETTRDLSAQQDLPALLQTIVDRAVTLLSAPSGGMYLFHATEGYLDLAVTKGQYLPIGLRVALGEGMAGRVARTQLPMIVDNYRTWPYRSSQLDGLPFTATVQVPMLYGGELIGVLTVNEIDTLTRKFTEGDVRLLSLFAAQAASAVHNARLFQETHTRAHQLSLLYDAGLALNSVLEPKVQLEFLFKIAMKTLRAFRAEMFRYNPARQSVEFELAIGYEENQAKRLSSLNTLVDDENSLIAFVAKHRIPLNLPDVFADPRWVTIDPETHSGLWVPIEHEKQLRGVIGLFSPIAANFTPQDERLLVLFANQAAVAMENARLFSETQMRIRDLALVNQISATVNQPLALADVLTNTLRELTRVLGVDRGEVATFGHTEGHLTIIAEHDLKGSSLVLGETIPLAGNPSMDFILRERRALAITDVRNDPVLGQAAPLLLRIGARSALLVPLIVQDQVIGTIGLDSQRQIRIFSESEIVLAQTIANQAAAALEKARLFEETRHRADRLALLNRIASAINQTLHLDELLEVVYREITATLRFDAFFIALYDPKTNQLDYRVGVDQGVREARVSRPLAQGPTQQTIVTRQAVLIRDWEKETDQFPAPELWGTMLLPRSWLSVPLRIGNIVVGVLCVQTYLPNAFGEAEEQLLTTIADQVASSIERAQLFEETQRRALEQTTVSDIANALNASLDVREAFPTIVRGLRALADCEHMDLAWLGESGDRVTMVLLDNPNELLEQGTLLPVTASSSKGTPPSGLVTLDNHSKEASASSQPNPPLETGFESSINLPLVAGDRVIGMLNLATRHAGAFPPEKRPALHQIANALAIAVQNTRLLEAEQTRRAELASLYDLSRVLADSTNFDEILSLVVRRTVETLHVTFARVALLDGNDLVYRAAHPARILERDLGIGSRETLEGHPRCLRALELESPTIFRDNDPELNETERRAFLLDVARIVCLVPLRIGHRVLGLLMVGEARREEREPFTPEKLRLAGSIGDQAASALRRAELFSELERAYLQAVLSLANAVDAKDTYTADHGQRLAIMAVALGKAMGLEPEELEDLRYGALLHDIGKIGVPDAILQKPARLDEAEWERMRRHPDIGAQILKPIPRLARAAVIIRHHHERFDGSGYPDGLGGDSIPLAARVLAAADAYCAIVDKRVYKAASSQNEAISELNRNAGTQFDPRVVETLLKLLDEGLGRTSAQFHV